MQESHLVGAFSAKNNGGLLLIYWSPINGLGGHIIYGPGGESGDVFCGGTIFDVTELKTKNLPSEFN